MRKIWDKLVALLVKVPKDKLPHLIAGLIVASLFTITFKLRWCIAPAVFAGLAKEAFDKATTGIVEWSDLLATIIGGLIIQILVLL